MMRIFYLILLIIAVSCTSKGNQEVEEVEQIQEVTINHTLSQMQLVGEAQTVASQWIAYQEFITSLENLDHTTASSKQLVTHINDMKLTIPESFLEQGILSRFKVLETRVKSYNSLLTHTQIDPKEQQKRFDQLVISLDQLKIQMMDKFIAQQQEENLLKNLEENELLLDQPLDSIEE